MWTDLLAAVALMLVFEGMLPFLAPQGMRRAWKSLIEMNDQALRVVGLSSMIFGLLLLYLVRS